MASSVRRSFHQFGRRRNVVFLLAALTVGMVLGALVLATAPQMAGGSKYRLVFAALMGVVAIGALAVGDLQRGLLLGFVLLIPLNLAFSPVGEVPYHAGGAAAGVILYPYDLPLIGLIALWLIKGLSGRKPIQLSRIDGIAILLIGWSMLSTYNSSSIGLSLFELLRMVKLYLLSLAVTGIVESKRDLRDVLFALLIGIIFQSVIAVCQSVLGIDIGLGFQTVGDLRRVSGTVGWPNTFGAYAATITSVLFGVWICGAGGKLRIPITAGCVAGFVALILSYSRGAWISLFFGTALGILLARRAGFLESGVFGKLALIVLTGGLVGAVLGGSILSRLGEVGVDMDVIVDRMKLNEVALHMIAAHPVLGVGINTFVDVMKEYDTSGIASYFPEPVHNVFLLVAAETGLVGLGLFLVLIGDVFRVCLQAAEVDERFLAAHAIAIASGLLVLTVNNLSDVHLRTDVLYTVFWFLIGLAGAVRGMTLELGRRGGMAWAGDVDGV